ncbi:MAG: tetratricopeptide repeat protein [Thermoanaerobaculia bacterium]|nr:tetratricopeptide repeat protein [Thermoanaerobaculia bacterium]
MTPAPRRYLHVLLRSTLIAALAIFGACSERVPTSSAALVEVPEPVLDAVEPSVRQQIREAQQAATQGGESASAAAAWGTLASTYHAYDFLEAAGAAYTNARQLDPESFRWAYLQGVLREELGQKENAIAALDAALGIRPENLTARVRRASIRRDLGDLERAREELESVLSETDDVALAHYLLGQLDAHAGEWQRAVQRFERVLEIQPQASRVRYPLSRAYARLGRADAAEAEAEQSGTVDVTLTDPLLAELSELERGAAAYVRKGAQRQIAGDWRGAVAAYRTAVETDPQHLEARMSLGGALVEIGDFEGAEEHLRRAVEIEPLQALAWYNLAGVLRARERFDEAIDAYDRAIERSPDDDRFQLARARTLRDGGRAAEARAAYQGLAAKGALDAEFDLARLDAQQGRRRDAIARTEALLGRDLSTSQRRLAHLLLADWLARGGATEAALSHYEAAAETIGDPSAEADLASRAQLLDALLGRANLLGTLGRLREAAEAYEKVNRLDPSRPEAWLGGATAAALSGDWADARRRLETGLASSQPEHQVDLRHTLARLLATAPVAEVRDGELALQLARAALDEGGPVDYAETVGMALAELGRWQEAIDWQQRVIRQLESAGETQRAGQARALLQQYGRRLPVRQGAGP